MKSLLDLDYNYQKKISKLTSEERINYCNKLIDKYAISLEKSKFHLGDELKTQFKEIITAAQKEIARIDIQK